MYVIYIFETNQKYLSLNFALCLLFYFVLLLKLNLGKRITLINFIFVGISSNFLAGYRLPEVGEIFTEVEFAGVSKEEAEELVKKYNKEGIDAGYGGQRSANNRGGGRYFRGGRGKLQSAGFFDNCVIYSTITYLLLLT